MKILIYEAREAKGISLRELESITNISKSTLNNLETGQVSPNLEQLELIAKALNTKITALFISEYK